MAIMCISCVYMGLHLWMRNKSKVCIRYSKNVRTHAYKWNTHGRPDNNLDVFGIPKNPYFNPSHASITSEMKILHISKWPLPQKYASKTFSMSFLAWKEKEPKNIYTDRNWCMVGCCVMLAYFYVTGMTRTLDSTIYLPCPCPVSRATAAPWP